MLKLCFNELKPLFIADFKIKMSKLTKFTEISRKIVAVGINFSEHAVELGNAIPSKPLLFMKVSSTIKMLASKLQFLNCIIATLCFHH